MAMIDVNRYIEQSGMRKARFGGYEPDDVRQAMLDLCSEYEQRLNAASADTRAARQEADALRRRCQTLMGQNQSLTAQNASLAAKADRIAQLQSDMETRYAKVQERNHSLTDQVAVLRLKNSDLVRDNKELTERAENADAALLIKGREHESARRQVLADRDKVLADARTEAARIRQQAKDDADQLLQDTNLKAEAIDQLAREQAIGQARKMVQAATDETREIQNAHRLRLQDLQGRIASLEEQRTKLLNFLSDMIGELQEAQDYARQNGPVLPADAETTPAETEPKLDLSATAVDAAAQALRTEQSTEPELPAPQEQPAVIEPENAETPHNQVVTPGWNAAPEDTRVALPVVQENTTPSPEYFDTPAVPETKKEPEPEIEIPGAIFSYPILRQKGEPILDEEPPVRGPHTPVLPDLSDDEDEDAEPNPPAPVKPTPGPQKPVAAGLRRKKAVAALRALHRKLGM